MTIKQLNFGVKEMCCSEIIGLFRYPCPGVKQLHNYIDLLAF